MPKEPTYSNKRILPQTLSPPASESLPVKRTKSSKNHAFRNAGNLIADLTPQMTTTPPPPPLSSHTTQPSATPRRPQTPPHPQNSSPPLRPYRAPSRPRRFPHSAFGALGPEAAARRGSRRGRGSLVLGLAPRTLDSRETGERRQEGGGELT